MSGKNCSINAKDANKEIKELHGIYKFQCIEGKATAKINKLGVMELGKNDGLADTFLDRYVLIKKDKINITH